MPKCNLSDEIIKWSWILNLGYNQTVVVVKRWGLSREVNWQVEVLSQCFAIHVDPRFYAIFRQTFYCCTQRCYWPSSGVNITQAAVCSCLDFHHEQDEGRSRLVFDWCMLIFLLSDLHQVQRRKRSRHFIVHWRDEKETGIAFTDMFICFDHLQIESDRKTGMAIYLRWPSPDTKWQKDRHGSDWCVFTNLSWPSLDTKENVRQTCLWVSVFTNLCDFHQVQKRTWDRHVCHWRRALHWLHTPHQRLTKREFQTSCLLPFESVAFGLHDCSSCE